MPETDLFSRQEILEFLGSDGEHYYSDLSESLFLLQQGKNIGSALKFTISKPTRIFLISRLNEFKKDNGILDIQLLSIFLRIRPFIEILIIITDKYESVVTNPPYLPTRNMNKELKDYVEQNYPKTSSDLFAVFMEVISSKSIPSGKMAIINQWSWMCIDTYSGFRKEFLTKFTIDSLLHLGIGVFPELNTKKVQSVSLSFTNGKIQKVGIYVKLDETFKAFEKEKLFLQGLNRYHKSIDKFKIIPENPICFWIPDELIEKYLTEKTFNDIVRPCAGMQTGDNSTFVRYWYEVDIKKVLKFCNSAEEAMKSQKKWFPYNNGGGYQKWYGNEFYLVNWKNNGQAIKEHPSSTIRNKNKYFKQGISWSLISLTFSARYSECGHLFDVGGSSGFPEYENLHYSLAFLNSKVSTYLLSALNFTLNVQVGDIKRLLFIPPSDDMRKQIIETTIRLIEISKFSFDLNELSSEFKSIALLNSESCSLREVTDSFNLDLKQKLIEFISLEKKINNLLIELYHLGGVLDSTLDYQYLTIFNDYISLGEIRSTSTQQDLAYEDISINKLTIIVELLSYFVGILMGRYRLDKPELNIAHKDLISVELESYNYYNHVIEIDQDAIIPILGDESSFSDDLTIRIRHLVETLWGEKTLTMNINFIEEVLGMTLEKYLSMKFWDYHKTMYKKTPIYWLFESPKGSFRVLTYMHRMDKFTVQKIRLNYLHRYMDHLSGEIDRLKGIGDNLRRIEKLENALIDCRDYSDILKPLADRQITFDLDDGVKKNYKLFEGAVKPI